MLDHAQSVTGYYGRPIVKPPAWTDLIPVYFFTGGMAGTAATLAGCQRAAKNHELARVMIGVAAGGCAVSAFCLVADLKRPERFLHMLRVFKPTSPMSVGVYIFSAFSTATFAAAASDRLRIATFAGRAFEALAALIGPAMSCYTAVLIADTAVPAWLYGRHWLPAVFASTSATAAGAAGMLACEPRACAPARRLAIAGAIATLIGTRQLHEELGPRQALAYTRGQAGAFAAASRVLGLAGIAATLVAGKHRTGARAAGALLFAAALCEKFSIYRAGCASTKDPSFVIDAQA